MSLSTSHFLHDSNMATTVFAARTCSGTASGNTISSRLTAVHGENMPEGFLGLGLGNHTWGKLTTFSLVTFFVYTRNRTQVKMGFKNLSPERMSVYDLSNYSDQRELI